MKIRIASITAIFLAFVMPADAQQTSPQPAPNLNKELLKPLPPAPSLDTGKFGNENGDNAGLSLPDKIDLGKSILHFDTSRSESTPRVGVETIDPKAFYSGVPTHKDSEPRYFGLRLTKPTQ